MSQVIRIPEHLYQRLAAYVEGFETPSQVIERILDFYENESNIKPKPMNYIKEESIERATNLEIIYYPINKASKFKKKLIKNKRAYIKLSKMNGDNEIKEWNANKFTESSDILNNLRGGYLRGWRDRGIFRAELSTNRDDL